MVTINDVAAEAGVSITTVSRVVNNNYPVKQETRDKIEKAIEKLNYKPNAAARSLITKRSTVIGITVPGITNLFFPTIVEEIGEALKKKGYSISLTTTGGDYKSEKELIDIMVSRQVDGIIAIDPSAKNLKDGFYSKLSETVPTIVVNGSPNGFKCNQVCYDEEIGTREAFNYLYQLGHKKIAFIRGAKSFSYDLKEKIYKEFVDEKQLGYKNILNVGEGNSIEVVEKSQDSLMKILSSGERPTAVFACNDLMAVGVINACSILKIKIPGELSVIGFDNTLLADITNPKLTSVDQNMKDIGQRAAAELLDIIENGQKARKKIILDTTLVIRDSCSQA